MTLFITGNQTQHREVAELLADLEIRTRKLDLPRPDTEDLHAIAEARVLAAYARVGEACFTETTALELEGLPPLSGAMFKKRLATEGEAALCRALGGRRGQVRVVLAYTADGVTAQLFTGDSEGTFLAEPRGDGGYGWDRAWLPVGYQRTLAEMATNKAFVNMRRRPYLELGDLLRGRAYGGSFEAHITVRRADPDRFIASCDRLGVKAVLIELPVGATPSQPMTASYHHGTLAEAQEQVHELARALAADGFDVTRVKLEAVGKNADIPETEAAAAAAPKNYFEYHIKVVVPPGSDATPLRSTCERHGAHLSRNARSVRPDGAAERFVTLRVYGAGRVTAEARFVALLADVRALGLPLGQKIREYTVYDTAEDVDRGWIDRT